MRLFKLLASTLLLALLYGCAEEKEFPEIQSYPILKTLEVVPDATGITAEGEFTNLGKEGITEYGFEYGETYSQTFDYKKVIGSTPILGTYETKITDNLVKGNNYIIRTYAKHGHNITYGNTLAFTSAGTSPPFIEDFNPKSTINYGLVTIYGHSFGGLKKLVKVTVGELPAQVLSVHNDSIVIITPAFNQSGVSYPITVTVQDKSTTPSQKLDIVKPQISHLSKSYGMPGEELTIFGNIFNSHGNYPIVSIGNQQAEILSRNNTQIRVHIPRLKANMFDKELTVSVKIGSQTASFPNAFILESGFKTASSVPPSIGLTSTRMPSFVADDKAFFLSGDQIVSYAIASGSWRVESTFPSNSRHNSIFKQVGSKAYLIGGNSDQESYSDVWEYDYRQNSWTRLTDLPFTVSRAISFTINDNIYFFGGNNSNNQITLWRYNPKTEGLVALNNAPGYFFAGFSFVSRGITHVIMDGHVWSYNVQQDSWTKRGYHGFSSSGTEAFTFKDEGYVISNRNEYNQGYALYRYDAEKAQWVIVAWYPECINVYNSYGFATSNRLFIGTSGYCSSPLYYYEGR